MHKYSDGRVVPYTFKIAFPGSQHVTLRASSKTEADVMELALCRLNADYVIEGPGWTGGSLQMTPAAHRALARLAPVEHPGPKCH